MFRICTKNPLENLMTKMCQSTINYTYSLSLSHSLAIYFSISLSLYISQEHNQNNNNNIYDMISNVNDWLI